MLAINKAKVFCFWTLEALILESGFWRFRPSPNLIPQASLLDSAGGLASDHVIRRDLFNISWICHSFSGLLCTSIYRIIF